LFIKRCLDVALPELVTKVVDETKSKIDNEMNRVAIADIGVFSWAHLSARHVKSAESQFSDSTLKIHTELSSQPRFAVLLADLRGKVSDHVKQFQENLKRMSEAEAEKVRKLEEEKQELMKQQRDQEAEHRATLEQQQAAFKAQLEQQERHYQAMLAAQARAVEKQCELIRQLTAAHEESIARMERQREQDRVDAAQRDGVLWQEIRQFRDRPAKEVHI
jgi:hypothetical protein